MNSPANEDRLYILTVTCPGYIGTIAATSNFLAGRSCDIIEMAQFDDVHVPNGRYFLRIAFRTHADRTPPLEQLRREFESSATEFSMKWAMYDSAARSRVLIMVSLADHCLENLLYRYRTGELKIAIPAVVSNHPDLAPHVEWLDIPFIHLPVTHDSKTDQEARLWKLI